MQKGKNPMDTVNYILIGLAIVFLGIAAARAGIIRWEWKFAINTLPLFAMALVFALINWRLGGVKPVIGGTIGGMAVWIQYFPILLGMFFMMGQIGAITKMYEKEIPEFVGGKYGLGGCYFMGFALPGSLSNLPVVRDLWDRGTSLATILTFVCTAPLLSWQLPLLRVSDLGWKRTGIVYLASICIATCVYVLAWAIERYGDAVLSKAAWTAFWILRKFGLT